MSPDESLPAGGAKKKPRRRRSMEKIALWLFGALSNPAPPECGFAGEGRQIALKPLSAHSPREKPASCLLCGPERGSGPRGCHPAFRPAAQSAGAAGARAASAASGPHQRCIGPCVLFSEVCGVPQLSLVPPPAGPKAWTDRPPSVLGHRPNGRKPAAGLGQKSSGAVAKARSVFAPSTALLVGSERRHGKWICKS